MITESPLFKNDEKCFLFHHKNSFRTQDNQVVVMTFWSCRKNDSIRKTSLISKSITSQPCSQTIAIQILPNISRNKGNQAMKFGQLIEYNKRNIFVEKSSTKCAEETIPRPLSKNQN